ncbi:hypothetical protein Tco_0543219 [Tanacetum coccineum]
MLEKTFSTFQASNLLLQQQNRERGFIKYYDLISYLLMAEQNNELLVKNHESRPTGSTPLSEPNMETYNQSGGRSRGSDRGRGRGRGQRRGFFLRNDGGEKAKVSIENGCYRCGKWVEVNFAYQDDKIDYFDIDSFDIDSLGVDNLGVPEDQNDTTHLDVSDFVAND